MTPNGVHFSFLFQRLRQSKYMCCHECRSVFKGQTFRASEATFYINTKLYVAFTAGLQAALRFSPAAFFYGLLPPIVFAAGFTLKKRDFFRNFGTISVFAVPGTFISALFFGFVTYALVAIKVVKRSHLGTAPLIECLLYGETS